MPTIELIEHAPLTPRVSHFVFQAPFQHEAGQYLSLSALVEDTVQTRYYSIASPPQPSREIELCIQHEGAFGRHLRNLHRGERIECSEPGGKMRLLDAEYPAVYFAAGTGVSPMRAILLAQLAANPQADSTLLLGARHSSELLYQDEFHTLANRHRGFRFMPTVSGKDPAWGGRQGRLSAYVDEAIVGRTSVDAYFCGPREMVAQLRERLAEAGISDERQVYERY